MQRRREDQEAGSGISAKVSAGRIIHPEKLNTGPISAGRIIHPEKLQNRVNIDWDQAYHFGGLGRRS